MSTILKKTKNWVELKYSNANHLVRTVYWVKKLNSKASEALLLSALTHDIERAFDKGRKPPSPETKCALWDDTVYNRWHSARSAKFTAQFLREEGVEPKLIRKVSELIKVHEEGGGREADLLKDADSLSFLEINVPMFISRVPKMLSKEEVKDKFDYMFNRITSSKAKRLAKPLYAKAISKLNSKFQV